VSSLQNCLGDLWSTAPAVDPELEDGGLRRDADSATTLRRPAGVELIGKYEGSGRQTDRYLARHSDGTYVELTTLLYLVLSSLNGRRTSAEMAAIIGKETGRDLSADNVDYLLEKLLPLGLIEANRGSESQLVLDRPEMALGLRVKRRVLPARTVRSATGALQHLFYPPVVVLVVGAFVALIIDMILAGHLSTSVAALIDRPQLTLVLLGLMLVSMVFHEIGHASACRYGGATPGEIGGGLYLMWPALYTNVTDAYRLGRNGRVRTDLGGIYFNAVFCVVLGTIYQITGYAPLILAVATTTVLMLEQLLPFVRFDGYWIVSDLAGVPDLFPRLSAGLHRFVQGAGTRGRHVARTRGRHVATRYRHVARRYRGAAGPGIGDLRPYSRRIIVFWAGVTAVVLPVEMALTLLLSATLFVSFSLGVVSRYSSLQQDIAAGHIAGAAVDVIQGLLLVILLVGLAYALVFLSYRICHYAVRRWGGRGLWSRLLVAALVVGVLAAPVVWSATQVRLVNVAG
jgi:putative peptide zinc metalloprotease protein